jgi:4-methyl-5(b-hydroxyethyl)-thiazole monophosphate biosynthesis
MKAYIFLADGFEEIEAITPIDLLRRANVEITSISISNSKTVIGAHNISIAADAIFSEVNFEDADLLILPGGMPGTKNLDGHAGLKKILEQQASQGKLIAAICAAPSILGKMNLLEDKEAICYPGFENQLQGASLSERKVVQSGAIITAMGAGVAIEFSLKIIENLKGKTVADQIANSICQ